jgi:hypothetical protein
VTTTLESVSLDVARMRNVLITSTVTTRLKHAQSVAAETTLIASPQNIASMRRKNARSDAVGMTIALRMSNAAIMHVLMLASMQIVDPIQFASRETTKCFAPARMDSLQSAVLDAQRKRGALPTTATRRNCLNIAKSLVMREQYAKLSIRNFTVHVAVVLSSTHSQSAQKPPSTELQVKKSDRAQNRESIRICSKVSWDEHICRNERNLNLDSNRFLSSTFYKLVCG